MAHDQGCLVCNCGFGGFSVCGAFERERERERRWSFLLLCVVLHLFEEW